MKNIVFLALFIPCLSFSQTSNLIWCFGDSAGVDFSNTSNPMSFSSGFDGRGSCVSIADSNSNLLLYSGFNYLGQTMIFNDLNDTVSNSSNILGDGFYNGMSLIRFPKANNKYYLFCRTATRKLYYNIIYPDSNNGLGIVSQKNILVDANIIGDCVTAVKHGNGRDWWLITKYSSTSPPNQNNRFFVYLVTSDSIYTPIIQDFNDARDADFQRIIWHPTSDKFMLINIGGYMSEFGFDRCSGSITMIRNILPQQAGNYDRLFNEGAYSPNGNVFYVSTDDFPGITDTMYLFQLDLTDTNVIASIDTLETWPTNNISTGAVRLAPDNKIYFSRWYLCNISPYCYPYPDSVRNYVNENLSVINSPDSLGSACNYQPFSFYLGGKRTYAGLPNNPNYDLGAVVGSVCDSLTVSVGEVPNPPFGFCKLYPNPGSSVINYLCQFNKSGKEELFIQNALGEIIIHQQLLNVNTTINIQSLTPGIYYYLTTINGSVADKGKLIINR